MNKFGRSKAGILLMISGVMLLPFVDAAVKLLSERYPMPQLLGVRFFFPFWLVLAFTRWRHGPTFYATARPVLLIVRGLLWVGCNFFFATAIKYVPLADAIAVVFFSSPVLIILSWLFLHERISSSRWAAVALGLVSIMIIIRPGFEQFSPAILFALCAALLYGCYLFSTRLLKTAEPPLVIISYQLLGALLIFTPTLPFVWVKPVAADLFLLIAASLINILGHILIIRAFQLADASLLAPFVYAEIIMHIVLGQMLFGDFPDAWTWLGIIMIVGVGVYVSLQDPEIKQV